MVLDAETAALQFLTEDGDDATPESPTKQVAGGLVLRLQKL
jgi:hypothetical protein